MKLDESGAGAITIDRIDGPLTSELNGAGSLTVKSLDSAAVKLETNGASKISLKAGTIGSLKIEANGLADVDVRAAVTDASIELNGIGSIHIPQVSGKLRQSASGMGKITVGEN